jgi:hypothetical protein
MTANGEHTLLHEMLIDKFDLIFEKRWTVTGANGESSRTSTVFSTTLFSIRPVFPRRIPRELMRIPCSGYRRAARCDRPRLAR